MGLSSQSNYRELNEGLPGICFKIKLSNALQQHLFLCNHGPVMLSLLLLTPERHFNEKNLTGNFPVCVYNWRAGTCSSFFFSHYQSCFSCLE